MSGLLLHIERVVIDGLPLTAREARQLRGALETELARLFDTGAPHAWHSAALPRLAAPPLALTTPMRPVALGQAIARSVHASLTTP